MPITPAQQKLIDQQQPIDDAIAAMRVPVNVFVTADKLQSALVSAFEGGSNYWIDRVEREVEPSRPCVYHSDVPFFGGALRIVVAGEYRDEPKEIKLLTLETLQAAVALLAEKWPHHAADLLGDSGDATTGDVLIQCAIFGDIIFG